LACECRSVRFNWLSAPTPVLWKTIESGPLLVLRGRSGLVPSRRSAGSHQGRGLTPLPRLEDQKGKRNHRKSVTIKLQNDTLITVIAGCQSVDTPLEAACRTRS